MIGWGLGPYGEGNFGEGEPNAVINATGVEAVGEIGVAFTRQSVDVELTGVQAEGVFNELPPLAGWGVGFWGEGAWSVGNPNIIVSVTGVDASALLDPVGVAAGGEVEPAGFQAEVELGQEFVTAAANESVFGVEATGEIGTAVVDAGANVQSTGVEGVGETGVAAFVIKANVYLVGVQGNGVIGEEEEESDMSTLQL